MRWLGVLQFHEELRSVEGRGQIALAAVNIVKISPTLSWIIESMSGANSGATIRAAEFEFKTSNDASAHVTATFYQHL